MATSSSGDDFRVSNGESWTGTFSAQTPSAGVAPWAGLPAWQRGTAYSTGMAATFAGDLYIARPAVPAVTWTSQFTFDADVDAEGVAYWVLVGSASGWAQEPIDLTGATLRFAIWPCDATGNLIGDYPTLTAVTATGEVPILNAAGGGYGLAIASTRTAGVPAGTYRFDIAADLSDGTTARLRHGLWTVDQKVA